MKSKTGKKHVKQADSDEKAALVLAAQLSGARKWRNSTNNQVTNALKSVPSPLSKDDRLKAQDASSAYTDANNADQNSSGASNGISAQADYYKNAGVDLSQVSTLDSAGKNPGYNGAGFNGDYKGNSTSYASPDVKQAPSSPYKSSEQSVNNNTTYNPSSYDAQATANPYSNYSYQTATRNDGYSSETAASTADPRGSDTSASNTVGSNTAASNTAAYNSVGYNTAGYNTTETNIGGYNSEVSNTGVSNAVASNNAGSSAIGSNTDEANTDASNQSSSYYHDANNQAGVSAYTSSYGQQSTSKDTTDNTVPNGIENQTSYEMNPDASTAQYGNNQPAST